MTTDLPHGDDPPYIQPSFPDGWFALVALADEPWGIGPFRREDFETLPDGTLLYGPGQDRPIHPRVQRQEGDVMHANDGSVDLMSYAIRASEPPSWFQEL